MIPLEFKKFHPWHGGNDQEGADWLVARVDGDPQHMTMVAMPAADDDAHLDVLEDEFRRAFDLLAGRAPAQRQVPATAGTSAAGRAASRGSSRSSTSRGSSVGYATTGAARRARWPITRKRRRVTPSTTSGRAALERPRPWQQEVSPDA